MTNLERLRNEKDVKKIAYVLCDIVELSAAEINGETVNFCQSCIANKYCSTGHNGFLDWLNLECTES